MRPRRSRAARADWAAGLLNGLVTSTYSTLVVRLGARRIGRDPRLDWMHLGSILLRDHAITVRPRKRAMLAGILVHQSADVFWAAVWGRIAGRLGRRRQPVTVAAWLPWAAVTAAVEYSLILPWLQPLVRMEVPYWTATTVHVSSGAGYPLYPLARQVVSGRPEPGRRFAAGSALVLAAGLAALAAVAARRREPRWPVAGAAGTRFDRRFLRAMTAHHEVGVTLARLCAERAPHPRLQMLGRLMLGEHLAELDVMRRWWRSWYGGELPPPTAEDSAWMSGMPAGEDVDRLSREHGAAFEQRFLALMLPHHEGAVAMAVQARGEGGDPRIRLFGDAVAHAQRGQIAFMRRYVK